MHVPVWSSQNALGPQKGAKSKIHPAPSLLFATEEFALYKPNAFEGCERKYEEVFFLSLPFRSTSKHSDALWHFLSFKVIIYI